MNSTLTRPETPTPNRRPKWFPYALAGGAAAVVALGVGIGIAASGDDAGPAAAAKVTAVVERSPDAGPAPEVTPGPSMAMCMQFGPEMLQGAGAAFDGVVTAVDGTNVTFEVTHWYKGGTGDILVTDGVYITGSDTVLEGGSSVEVGGRYLVAAEVYTDAVRPGLCGWVQPYSADVAAVFAQAFGS